MILGAKNLRQRDKLVSSANDPKTSLNVITQKNDSIDSQNIYCSNEKLNADYSVEGSTNIGNNLPRILSDNNAFLSYLKASVKSTFTFDAFT